MNDCTASDQTNLLILILVVSQVAAALIAAGKDTASAWW